MFQTLINQSRRDLVSEEQNIEQPSIEEMKIMLEMIKCRKASGADD